MDRVTRAREAQWTDGARPRTENGIDDTPAEGGWTRHAFRGSANVVWVGVGCGWRVGDGCAVRTTTRREEGPRGDVCEEDVSGKDEPQGYDGLTG